MFLLPSWIVFAILTFIGQSENAAPKHNTKAGNIMPNVNPLTSHILDTTLGRPAANVKIELFKFNDQSQQWDFVSEQLTNTDGRVGNVIDSADFTVGSYKLRFDTQTYYDALNMETFYPYVEIVFRVNNPDEHYHVPLLLNPYGYSTYRGS